MLSDINFTAAEIWGHQTKKKKKFNNYTHSAISFIGLFPQYPNNSEVSFLPHLLSFPSLSPSLPLFFSLSLPGADFLDHFH